MIPRSVKAPTIPIPFHRLLKVVAIVDPANAQTKELIDLIRAENFEVEVTDRLERDVHEDASVGAYIASIDGDRREAREARSRLTCARSDSTRRCGRSPTRIRSPISPWSAAWARSTATSISASRRRRSTRSRSSASLVKYGLGLLPPFFGGLMAYDANATIAFDCPGSSRRPVLQEVAGRTAVLQTFRRGHLPQRPVQRRRRSRRSADPRRRGRRSAEARGARLRRRPDVLRAERHEHVEQGRDGCAAEGAATSCCSTATTTSRCTRADSCRPARSRSSCRPRATRSA